MTRTVIASLLQNTIFGISSASILALAAVGLTLQYGVTRLMNLSFGAFMTLAAFLTFSLTALLHTFWIAVILAVLSSASLAVLFHRGILVPFQRRNRTDRFVLLMVLFSFYIIVPGVIQVVWGSSFFSLNAGEHVTLRVLSVAFTTLDIQVIGVAVLALLAVLFLLKASPLGRSMRAIADDLALAELSGIPTTQVMDATWGVSGALCGLAGVVLAINTASFNASTGTIYLPSILAAAIVGGIGSPEGAVVGSLIIGVLGAWVSAFFGSSASFSLALVVLILVLLLRPQGLFSSAGWSKKGAIE